MAATLRAPRQNLDYETLLASATGDRVACRLLLRYVHRIAAALLGPAHPDIEDAAQESCIKVVQILPRFDVNRGDDPGPWLNRVVVRVVIDHHRKSQRRQSRLREPQEDDELADSRVPDPIVAIDVRQHRALLGEAISLLSTEQRAVIVLKYWGELGDEEIAEDLGIPAGTVKSRIFRSHNILRSFLKERLGV